MRGFIKCPVARPLAAHRPRGENLALSSINDLDLTADGIENKQCLSGLIHQNLGRADTKSDVANVLVILGVDDSQLSVVLLGGCATVSHIKLFAAWIVGYAIRAQVQANRVEKIESTPTKNFERIVIFIGDEHLVKRRDVGHSLRRLEAGNATRPFPCPQVHHFQRAVFQPGYE